MRRQIAVWIGLLLLITTRHLAVAQGQRIESLDAQWRFSLNDAHDAMQPSFDDSRWRLLDVPHDWSIEGPIRQDNSTGPGGAFLPAGIGWYRKQFSLRAADTTRRVWIEFDGVMANSEVWINGFLLGKRPNGYVGFRYELTGHVQFGPNATNLLAVRADNSAQPASRWYSGGGIYRHVRLLVTEPVAIPAGGIFVTTPMVTDTRATVRVHTVVENGSSTDRRVLVHVSVMDPEGHHQYTVRSTGQVAPAGTSLDFTQEITISNPALWDPERPRLYRAVIGVEDGKRDVGTQSIPFGFREARFEAATGFWLNGKNLKIKGVCLHQEAGALGMAVPRSVWERRLTKLKEIGVNAIRTAHTPFSPDFLNVCDQLGFLVMDEMFDCWTVGKTPYDYHLSFKEWAQRDAHDTVVRDRNHPCVILYSIGNEIHDTPNAPLARTLLTSLRDVVHTDDPTRPVTQALFRPNSSHDYTNGLADLLDVVGQNYRENEILAAHRDKPERKILGTENGHDRRAWLAMRDNPAYAGQFLWAGIDYLGEAKRWPAISFDYGLFDRTLNPHPRAFERQSWWSDTPMVQIARRVAPTPLTPTDPGYEAFQAQGPTLFCDWSPHNPTPHDESVEVYSNCESVELFLNEKSLGIQLRPADASPRHWRVAFTPGILRAVGRNGGKDAAATTLRTAGKPAHLVLTTDRTHLSSDWDEVAFVKAEITDADGTVIPDASDNITFAVTGAGVLAGLDNGDLASHESFRTTEHHAYEGRCLAILRAVGPAGMITLSAAAAGFPSVSLVVQTTAPTASSAP